MIQSYKDAGVSKEEGYSLVERIKKRVKQTHNSSVIDNYGSFAALYELGSYKNPILVSGTDGVGTKLKIALAQKDYQSIGIDCFAMCVNDIVCCGAKPLFFLDYLACGKLDATIASQIVEGMTKACLETDCALVGGETAEMPDMYQNGDYDVAGFCVGIVEKEDLIDGKTIQAGQTILALPSSGFHSNGYSLIRKIFTDYEEIFENQSLGKILLQPTVLYSPIIHQLLQNKFSLKGIAHITGGGIIENIPRMIPNGLCAQIDISRIRIPSVMHYLQKKAEISSEEMFGTFNMGVGMALVVEDKEEEAILSFLKKQEVLAYKIGQIIENKEKIHLLW